MGCAARPAIIGLPRVPYCTTTIRNFDDFSADDAEEAGPARAAGVAVASYPVVPVSRCVSSTSSGAAQGAIDFPPTERAHMCLPSTSKQWIRLTALGFGCRCSYAMGMGCSIDTRGGIRSCQGVTGYSTARRELFARFCQCCVAVAITWTCRQPTRCESKRKCLSRKDSDTH